MKNMKKTTALLLAVVLLVCAAVGATIAWLTDKTETVTNTFTVSDVDIALAETTGNTYKMVPGWTITKDPVATVLADSEDCYLFVKVEKSANFKDFMTYEMADGWTLVPGQDNVYYREVAASTTDQPFAVIKDNKITVLDTVTKANMDALTANDYPTLDVTAYATQLWKSNKPAAGATDAEIAAAKFAPAAAWDLVK